MPCNGDYMNPTQEEENRKQVASLIVYVNKKLKVPTPNAIKEAAEHVYGEGVDLNKVTAKLCGTLSKLTKKQEKEIVYNARDKKARELADWWEEHQEEDKKRLQEEMKNKKDDAARKKAIAKLSPHERKLLGLK